MIVSFESGLSSTSFGRHFLWEGSRWKVTTDSRWCGEYGGLLGTSKIREEQNVARFESVGLQKKVNGQGASILDDVYDQEFEDTDRKKYGN